MVELADARAAAAKMQAKIDALARNTNMLYVERKKRAKK